MSSDRPAIRLGLRENVGQVSLLVIVNAFVGAMVGMERSILPAIAEQDFQLVARVTGAAYSRGNRIRVLDAEPGPAG
jgi:hypothetical protein